MLVMPLFLQVCSTDGVTYENTCELDDQAAVMLDYFGECLDTPTNREEQCIRVLEENLCVTNLTNCDVVVFTGYGCCPICGI